MNEQFYRNVVSKLMNPKLTSNERLGNWAAGLCGESAEVDEIIGNTSPTAVNKNKLLDELSDCRWYMTAFCVDLHLSEQFTLDSLNASYMSPVGYQSRLLMRQAGRVADLIKKIIYHGHPLERHRDELITELVKYSLIYGSLLTHFSLTDEQVKQHNYDKLIARYEGLNFTTEQSINRVKN
jgi:hypothetical protein